MMVKTIDLKENMELKEGIVVNNIVLIEEGTKLTKELIERIKKFNIEEVSIKDEEKNIEDILLEEEKIKEEFKKEYLESIEDTKEVLEDVLNNKIDDTTLELIVDKTMGNIEKDKNILLSLMDMKSEGEYLFDHSLKTTMLAIMLGKELNYTDEELEILGKAAILHDVGMLKVKKEIIDKKSKLTLEEMEEVKKHIDITLDLLKNEEKEVLEIIKYHHERIDGKGYPNGLKSEDIPDMSKVLKIADIYAALVSNRSYRKAFNANEAIKEMVHASGKEIDLILFKKFLKIMSMFPIGSKVRLSNGKIAIVKQITENIFRPVIDIEENGKIERIDLSKKENFLLHIMGLAE
ncbi:HD-GYP domain-containing protein (c-di-GMP phosphodiesterase class II) [Hypnocyclicus thermotrophus]|uniref:HD-GYP domain-containing protein (C-di-GMP phosphodiesterase class II) n=1 Tax=Hypnocyclicus thermotrophus TaxID=1627895 RepID=A0AA46I533_9FUSO|nr:HD-GYP domain-containing protein [Hypnocyclicus thermotrophus]TDT68587.1 HD-GYP domain-containing protein (c-di-GMP phosphodiesterase class II) [Hypnocyclicus thermotrophus]